MDVFKNFIFVVILVGVLTRIVSYFFSKIVKKAFVIYLSFLSVAIILFPIVSLMIGFDVAVSQYLFSLVIWLIFDLIRINVDLKKVK
ncbi:MAG: hypothetical protein WC688_03945 [Parachlamydiales bacterium]|jgi:hypothetical protein